MDKKDKKIEDKKMENKKLKDAKVIKEQPEVYDANDRHEIIEGVRYDFKPSPILEHQILVMKLTLSLETTCEPEGIVVTAPMDVHFDKDNTLQPDIIFITNENLHIIHEQKIMGAPDLVVEILSPSTGNNDKIRKKAIYERFGVQEYWIVDAHHFTIDIFILEKEKFLLHTTVGIGDTLTSDRFPCISVDIETLFKSITRFRN